MMVGIDETFDGVVFIGYHSASYEDENPLAHTFTSERAFKVMVNDKIASEFSLNARIAAYYGVPILFLSGDQGICTSASELVPKIETYPTKYGIGGGTFNHHPMKSVEGIKAGVTKALENLENKKLEKEENLVLEICFKDHKNAHRASFYDGVEQIDSHSVKYVAKDILDLMKARMFIL